MGSVRFLKYRKFAARPWQVSYNVKGKRFRKCFATESEAYALLAEVTRIKSDMTLQEAVEECKELLKEAYGE